MTRKEMFVSCSMVIILDANIKQMNKRMHPSIGIAVVETGIAHLKDNRKFIFELIFSKQRRHIGSQVYIFAFLSFRRLFI
jgi:uncharacterized protein (DUF1786 family)